MWLVYRTNEGVGVCGPTFEKEIETVDLDKVDQVFVENMISMLQGRENEEMLPKCLNGLEDCLSSIYIISGRNFKDGNTLQKWFFIVYSQFLYTFCTFKKIYSVIVISQKILWNGNCSSKSVILILFPFGK